LKPLSRFASRFLAAEFFCSQRLAIREISE
jgi:hypothetical protein